MTLLNKKWIDSTGIESTKAIFADGRGGVDWKTILKEIDTNLILHVSTTGSDITGDGSVGNPWASPHKAIDWLSDKWIDNGIKVIIYIHTGEYSFSEPVVLNHPCGSLIEIIGETLLPSNNYEIIETEYDCSHDIIYVTGDVTGDFPTLPIPSFLKISSASPMYKEDKFVSYNGYYKVLDASFDSINTKITLDNELYSRPNVQLKNLGYAISSPWSYETVLNFDSDAFIVKDGSTINRIDFLRIRSDKNNTAINVLNTSYANIGAFVIIDDFEFGIKSTEKSYVQNQEMIAYGCNTAFLSYNNSIISGENSWAINNKYGYVSEMASLITSCAANSISNSEKNYLAILGSTIDVPSSMSFNSPVGFSSEEGSYIRSTGAKSYNCLTEYIPLIDVLYNKKTYINTITDDIFSEYNNYTENGSQFDPTNPDDITSIFYFKSDKEYSLNIEGNKIVKWNDLSGNNNHLYADISYAPDLQSGIQGLTNSNLVKFSGSEYMMGNDDNTLKLGTEDFTFSVTFVADKNAVLNPLGTFISKGSYESDEFHWGISCSDQYKAGATFSDTITNSIITTLEEIGYKFYVLYVVRKSGKITIKLSSDDDSVPITINLGIFDSDKPLYVGAFWSELNQQLERYLKDVYILSMSLYSGALSACKMITDDSGQDSTSLSSNSSSSSSNSSSVSSISFSSQSYSSISNSSQSISSSSVSSSSQSISSSSVSSSSQSISSSSFSSQPSISSSSSFSSQSLSSSSNSSSNSSSSNSFSSSSFSFSSSTACCVEFDPYTVADSSWQMIVTNCEGTGNQSYLGPIAACQSIFGATPPQGSYVWEHSFGSNSWWTDDNRPIYDGFRLNTFFEPSGCKAETSGINGSDLFICGGVEGDVEINDGGFEFCSLVKMTPPVADITDNPGYDCFVPTTIVAVPASTTGIAVGPFNGTIDIA